MVHDKIPTCLVRAVITYQFTPLNFLNVTFYPFVHWTKLKPHVFIQTGNPT